MIRQICLIALLATGPVAAQDAASLTQLIDESIGYVTLDSGIVLIEQDAGSTVCRIGISDVFFYGYQAGDDAAMASEPPSITCVPTSELVADALAPRDTGVSGLDELISGSIGYLNVSPGVVMIEDDLSSTICRVQIDDAYFLAYATGNAEGRVTAAPTIICVPTPELAR